jgi:glucosamine-6-phosphate deaminase
MTMKETEYDKPKTFIFPDRAAMGEAASQAAAETLRAALTANSGIDWSRVTVFHMDEYVGLDETHPASFRAYQKAHFLSRVAPAVFHGIRGEAPDLQAEIERYTALFNEKPIDLVCMGIGENGHIAFNDPPVADFNDSATIKLVELDAECRQQQVNDGCFATLDSVPKHALSLSCPALMSARAVVCTVPNERKAAAVAATLTGPISTACPASILRTHTNARLYLDAPAACLLGMVED